MYSEWKSELMGMERFILKELGFSLYEMTDSPHRYILYFIKLLNGDDALAKRSWNYLNDSMRIDLCLRYEAQTIVCAAIFLASRDLEFVLPESPPWWAVLDIDSKTLLTVCDEILSVYHEDKV